MQSLNEFLKTIFSIFLLIAITGGAIVFFMFVIALIAGGSTGANLATSASGTVMPYFIKSAAIAMFAGLFSLYVSKSHQLSLGEENKNK